MACESINMAPEGKFMKRSSWSTLTVSQAKEAYRKSSLNLEKPMTPTDLKANLRPCHYLQVSLSPLLCVMLPLYNFAYIHFN